MKKISHSLLLLITIIGIQCFSCVPVEQRTANWSTWDKIQDIPGIEYRTTCLGQEYPGSKFTSCQVELFNEYTIPVNLEMRLTDLSGEQVSEFYTLKLQPENNRRVVFYNVGLECGTNFKVDVKEVRFN